MTREVWPETDRLDNRVHLCFLHHLLACSTFSSCFLACLDLFSCLLNCLFACLLACLLACMLACLLACPFLRNLAYRSACLDFALLHDTCILGLLLRLLLVEATRSSLKNEIHHRFSYRLLACMLACMLSLSYCMTWLFPFLLLLLANRELKSTCAFRFARYPGFRGYLSVAKQKGSKWRAMRGFDGPLSYLSINC